MTNEQTIHSKKSIFKLLEWFCSFTLGMLGRSHIRIVRSIDLPQSTCHDFSWDDGFNLRLFIPLLPPVLFGMRPHCQRSLVINVLCFMGLLFHWSSPSHPIHLPQDDAGFIPRDPRSEMFMHTGRDLSGTESRIANRTIPRFTGLESQEIPQGEAKNESNLSKTESRKIDSELPSESRPINA